MTRILLIETASPKRIIEKAGQILASSVYPNPELFVLCTEKNASLFRALPGATVYALSEPSKSFADREIAGNRFDVLVAFWTGEKRYRLWKILGFRMKAKETYIVGGDGNEFRLTWKAICRHAIFRFQHPLPSDDRNYASPEGGHERILIIQSAEPAYVLNALDKLRQNPPFTNPQYTIFCRNKPEIVNSFRGHPMLYQVLTHVEALDSWKHLRKLKRTQFDAIVLFLTGDPSYWKIKPFAFFLGTRRILIFNESSDCFFFNFHRWLGLISHRVRAHSYPGSSSAWGHSSRILISLVLKSVLFPFRFLWLLLVWLRLRSAGLSLSRET